MGDSGDGDGGCDNSQECKCGVGGKEHGVRVALKV